METVSIKPGVGISSTVGIHSRQLRCGNHTFMGQLFWGPCLQHVLLPH